jgi:heme/copper-type cytochrome/quinol oxidase subunit 4
MMEGPWFGIIIMSVLVVGLAWWIWKMMRKGKEE